MNRGISFNRREFFSTALGAAASFDLAVRVLGDRISHWCIFNEPWVFTFLGYGRGTHAPARTNFAECLRATHVVNIAQGQAFRAIKAINSKLQVGTAFSMSNCEPATKSDADRQATDRAHAMGNVWFVHPALRGEYPKAFPGENPLELMGVKSGDMELCRAPLDFLGINYYRRQLISSISPRSRRRRRRRTQFRRSRRPAHRFCLGSLARQFLRAPDAHRPRVQGRDPRNYGEWLLLS